MAVAKHFHPAPWRDSVVQSVIWVMIAALFALSLFAVVTLWNKVAG